MKCVVQDTFFFWRFLHDKELWFFLLQEFFPYFQDKILYYIFKSTFISYEALKNSRVSVSPNSITDSHVNFDKEIRRQLHLLLIQVHLFKNTRNVFCLKLIKVKTF